MKVKVKRLFDCGGLRYQFSTLSDDSVVLGEAFEIIEIEYLDIETEERVAYVHIQRIRQKLGISDRIQTVYKTGYRFEV